MVDAGRKSGGRVTKNVDGGLMMDLKEIAGKIANAAPMLGSLLGAPGAAAGTVIKLIADALGVTPEPPAIDQALKNNPDALLKLKELEFNNKVELQKLLLTQEELNVRAEAQRLADVSDARKREIETTKATGKTDVNLYALAWLIVGGFFILVGFLTQYTLPKDSNGVIFLLFGSLASGFGAVIQYFFGSSKSSADKTALLAQK